MTTASYNLNISGYEILDRIYTGSKTEVYRATDGIENRPVIIKILADPYPTFDRVWQFCHEYTITRHLQHPQILETYSLESAQNGYALVMEDFGGISLRDWLDLTAPSLKIKLQIAIDLTHALHELARHQIIHKDINPANILINPDTHQVKLIDFSIASLLPTETLEIRYPNILEGTLAYIAPEQTGRMNRRIDYRCDFYSLGITLFELFTGELPFHAEDLLGWVHCHLAQSAVSADLVNRDLPVVVAKIIAKLMAKNAEDRYQSALGIKFDLDECLGQLEQTGAVAEFEIGQRDISDRFSIPERLYGRAAEIQTLLDAFDRVAEGGSELMLVAGSSGIGKTAVINEVHKPIVKQRGYFIKGKYDQFNRNIPFSGFVQAFRELIGQLLSESDPRLAAWKSKILGAVGENGRILIEVIPELELIIGSQPPVTELASIAAQNRFNLLFQKFIEVFTTPEHPLTIFLDDLQWADSASLELLKLSNEGKGYLLLLGAYRDNEVSPIHPLMLTLAQLKQAETITLAPLTFDDTNRLIADTLHCSIESAKSLTELVDRKTQGNPFFTAQFLKALHEGGEIRFTPLLGWEWDLDRINALSLTDDVLEFMAAQLQKLPIETQQMLKLAACIGNKFELETLAIVSEKSLAVTTTALWAGLQAGLICLNSHIYQLDYDLPDLDDLDDYVAGVNRFPHPPTPLYRFRHDRVQQAAYGLIPEDEKQQTHLQVGRLLLANTLTPDRQQLEKLFEIVNHFNMAIDLIEDSRERVMLAQLNLGAAQKARGSAAYGAAFNYARIGIKLLGSSAWERQYQLALILHETLAEAAFVQGDLELVPALVQVVLDRAQTPLDRVKTYQTIIQFHTLQKQYQQAIDRGLEILRQLGIKLVVKPHKLLLLGSLVKTKMSLWGKSDRELLDLPETFDPTQIAPLHILALLVTPAFFVSKELLVMLATTGIQLTLRYGNTPWSGSFYGTYSVVLSGLEDLKQSYQIGQIANVLVDRFGDLAMMGQAKATYSWFAQLWQEDFRAGIPIVDESIILAMNSGNLTFLGIGAYVSMLIRFYAGIPLAEIAAQMPEIERVIAYSKDETSQQLLAIELQKIANLRQPSSTPYNLLGSTESISISQWKQDSEVMMLSTIYGAKTLLAYLFDDIPMALSYADALLSYPPSGIASATIFDPLTRLATYPYSNKQLRSQLLDRVDLTQRRLAKRARLMPGNFQHKYDLVAAEKCRVLGKFTQAMELYDRAILGAKTNLFLQEEAIANECAAKFYQGWGKSKIAAVYMQDAYYCYTRWGAAAKTADLERRYPQLLAPILKPQQPEFNPRSTLTAITHSITTNSCQSQYKNPCELAAAIESAQALSSIIELPALIDRLCQILLKNSGAQICIPILLSQQQSIDRDGWQVYEIDREHSEDPDRALQLICSPLEEFSHLPLKLIDLVRHRRETIILAQGNDLADDYLDRYRPQSVMCLPLLNRGELRGIVYLENRHTADVFTADRQIIVEFIAAQAVMTLHNAQLYESVAQRSAIIEASLIALHQSDLNLVTSQQKYYHLIQSINGVVWEYDLATERFSFVSDRAVALLGYPIDNWLAADFWESHIYPEDFDATIRTYNDAIEYRYDCEFEYRMVAADGRVIWVYDISTLVRDADGKPIGSNGLIIDISDLKQVETKLQQTNQCLELTNQELHRATRLKDEFLATMSHELRTPLNAILGMSEALQEEVYGDLNPRQLKSIATIERSGEHLLSLINDLLDVSKISAGKLELQITEVSPLELCQSSLIFVQQQAIQKQIKIQTQLSANLGKIFVDERRICQVFINLLNNAVKFTPNGGTVTLSIWIEPLEIEEYCLCISVSDTGIGIARADLSKLFQPFVQIDSSLSRKYEGTGLGLVLVKQIVELHGGAISIDSELGKGSCFTVKLPLRVQCVYPC
jgi:PAS domain S-box-containing protein